MNQTLYVPSEYEIERLDDIPLLLGLQQGMDLAEIIDESIPRHGSHQGLSTGQLVISWITYILSEADHRKVAVESWALDHRSILSKMLSSDVRRVDFTDDRLSRVLSRFACDDAWQRLEQKLWEKSVVTYDLEGECVRLDSSRISGYHSPGDEGLMQWGHPSKDTGLTQQKLMVASIDIGGCGHLISTESIPGQRADDVLYPQTIEKVRTMVGRQGLLYLGDSKMSAHSTRAQLACGGDFYLVPLAKVGDVPQLYQQCIDTMTRTQQPSTLIYQLDDSGKPTKLIATGYETTRLEQTTVGQGQTHSWTERILVVRSLAKAKKQHKTLLQKLGDAEKALLALTPDPGRGRRVIRDEAILIEKADAVLNSHGVADYLSYTYLPIESVKSKYVGRGRPGKHRKSQKVQTVHYRITAVIRNEATLQDAYHRMGTRLYATNCETDDLPFDEAIRLYRAAPRIERHRRTTVLASRQVGRRPFHLLKGKPIGISPMYVRDNDQIKGLTRLLTLCVRVLTLIEILTRRELARNVQSLAGLYEGNPNRQTRTPTATRLLRAFDGIDCIRCRNRASPYITPLNDLQRGILKLLALDERIYQPAEVPATSLMTLAQHVGKLLATLCYR